MPVFCPVCNLAVALSDPERVQRGLKVYHRPCLRKADANKEVIQPASMSGQKPDGRNWFAMYVN